MATTIANKKRKNIDLPVDALHKLSIMAAAQGKSVKAFIENILIKKADSITIEISNPSPSDDPFFANPKNLIEVESRIKEHKEGKTKATITLTSAEDIGDFLKNL